VLPSSGEAGWFARAWQSGRARVERGGDGGTDCAVRLVTDPNELARILELFRAKYGSEVTVRFFGSTYRALEIDPEHTAPPLGTDEILRGEFDSVAAQYDRSTELHPIDRYLKDRAVELLRSALEGYDPLLEIGPGTGYHTLPLLERGHRILAIDVSEQMLLRLRARLGASGAAERLDTRIGRLANLESILSGTETAAFRAAYSAFGAFNLEPEIVRAVGPLARVIAPNGRLEIVVLNRPGAAPVIWEAVAGRTSDGFRRVAETVRVGESRYPLDLHVPSIGRWDSMLHPYFVRRRIEPISVLAPPYESDRVLEFAGPQGSDRARRLDRRASRVPGAFLLAEWLLLEYERSTAAAQESPRPSMSRQICRSAPRRTVLGRGPL
jgi:ubiquinone/menaquinone biosynthesis C-methylase UbiE